MMSVLSIPSNELRQLGAQVSQKYEQALSAGDAFFYESHTHTTGTPTSDAPLERVPWQIRTVPALLKKPKSEPKPSSTEVSAQPPPSTAPHQNPRDVFAPPYVPNLLVKELPEFTVLVSLSIGAYAAEQILRAAAALPDCHARFVCVAHNAHTDFVPQERPPSPSMLALVYRIMQEHTPNEPHAEMLSFFNCGKDSGASQPHCHFQLVELTPTPGSSSAVPIETLLSCIEQDGKEHGMLNKFSHTDHVHLLPTPWQQFVTLLKPPADPTKLEEYLGMRFSQLLETMFAMRHEAEAQGASHPPGVPSFNVLLTKRALYLIPRSGESFDVRAAGWGVYGTPESAPENTGTLSVNALGALSNVPRR